MSDKELQYLIEYLSEFIKEERVKKFDEILSKRTNHVTVVLEDLHKPHNANAVLRSCDGFGLQDVHIIENKNEFDTEGTITLGAHRWLTLHRYNEPQKDNVDVCFDELRKQGYKVIATTPHEQDVNIYDLDVCEKIALVFGTELDGISQNVIDKADGFAKIPMSGFSESFNISVSAAICMYELTKKIRQSDIESGLDESYKLKLKLEWMKKSIKAGEQLVAQYLEKGK